MPRPATVPQPRGDRCGARPERITLQNNSTTPCLHAILCFDHGSATLLPRQPSQPKAIYGQPTSPAPLLHDQLINSPPSSASAPRSQPLRPRPRRRPQPPPPPSPPSAPLQARLLRGLPWSLPLERAGIRRVRDRTGTGTWISECRGPRWCARALVRTSCCDAALLRWRARADGYDTCEVPIFGATEPHSRL